MTGPVKTTLIAVGVALVLLLGALVLVPLLFEDRVLELVRTQVNERLEASVDFEDLDLSLLPTFPTLTVEIIGLEITGKGVFEGRQLASVPRLAAGLNLTRLILDEQLLIESFTLDDPELHFLVNEDGEANYDIVKESDEEPEPTEAEAEPRAFAVRLRQFEITDGLITYDAPGTHVSIEGLDHDGAPALDGATYAVASSMAAEALTVQLGRIRYLRKAKANLDVRATLRTDVQSLNIHQLEIGLNELTASGSGDIDWRDDSVRLDLELASGKGQSLRALVSAIPNAYAGELAGLRAKGRYSLGAKIKGRLGPGDDDVPSFSAYLFVRNGELQHPDLQLPVAEIALDAKVQHPGGNLDNMKIDVPSYAARAGRSHVSGRLEMTTPISQPDIALVVDGRLEMAEIALAYPISDVEDLQGSATVKLDLAAKGDHVRRLTGGIAASGIVVRTSEGPPAQISAASLVFTPEATVIRVFHATFGQSDIALRGSVSPFNLVIAGNETIVGEVELKSKWINWDDFESDEEFPLDVDVRLSLEIEKLTYRNLVLSRLRGKGRFNGELILTDVKAGSGRRYVETLLSELTK